MAVDFQQLVLVLAAFGAVFFPDDGEQVLGGIGLPFVQDVLHLAGPLHGEQLSRLLPAVGDVTVEQVLFAEIGHVDKRHAPHAETEDEHVARKVEAGEGGKVELLETLDLGEGDAPLDRLVYAAIDVPEGMAVGGKPTGNGHPIVGAEDAHVERGGVARQAAPEQGGFVKLQKVGVHLVEREVHALPEADEAVEGGTVGLAGTEFSYLSLVQDLGVDEVEDTAGVFPGGDRRLGGESD